MSTGERDPARSPLDVLITHLEAEAACLAELDALLEGEAGALRRLDLANLERVSRRKADVADRHRLLVGERAARMEAAAPEARPTCLSELRAAVAGRAEPATLARLAALHEHLRALAETVAARHGSNTAFAGAGRAVVEGALHALGRRQNTTSTYTPDGRVHAERSGTLVRDQG